jgi:uncharacterized protein (DUF3820 family)
MPLLVDRKYLGFGKYKGKSIIFVAESDPRYLKWMLKNMDLDGDVEDDIKRALKAARWARTQRAFG